VKTLKAHFDGKVLVPDEPVNFPLNQPLELTVAAAAKSSDVPASLDKLAELAQCFPADSVEHSDRATQHDHYLYGTPKRP
jgi:hypothetical protein